jgi:uncharacterized protein (TIGR02118 family)
MAGARLFVCYPHPNDAVTFEKAYAEEHIPMAAPILATVGAERATLTRLASTPQGKPPFHRIAEIDFPSPERLHEALRSSDFQRAVSDANRISTGGPVVAMISGEIRTVTL